MAELNYAEKAVVAAQFGYRALFAVCAAGLLFVFAPEEVNVRQAAVEELSRLLEFDFRSVMLERASEEATIASNLSRAGSLLEEVGLRISLVHLLGRLEPEAPDVSNTGLEEIDRFFVQFSGVSVTFLQIDDAGRDALRMLQTRVREEPDLLEGRTLRGMRPDNVEEGPGISFSFDRGAGWAPPGPANHCRLSASWLTSTPLK